MAKLALRHNQGQVGLLDVLDVSWLSASSADTTDSTLVTIPTTCKSPRYADIYYVALPGEQRKPYSINATNQFDQADAVNWSTCSFKADKLDVTQNHYAAWKRSQRNSGGCYFWAIYLNVSPVR